MKQIIDRLNAEFTGDTRKLVFWYDDKAEFAEDIDSVELENAKIYRLEPDNQFYTIDASADYIKNKAFDDQYYKDLIVEYLKQYGKAQKSDFKKLLIDKLPDSLSDNQKEYKIGNLLTSLCFQEVIITDPDNRLYWHLA